MERELKKKIKRLTAIALTGTLAMSTFLTNGAGSVKAAGNELTNVDLSEVEAVLTNETQRYEANTESLENYVVPEWYRDAKLGIFIHYGVYSVPAFGDEWYGHWMYIPGSRSYGGSDIYTHHMQKYGGAKTFGYKDFIPAFNEELKKFSDNNMAEKWAELFYKAGAKYVVPVGMHHDSFALYDSDVQKTYNSVTQAGVDYVGQLQAAVKNLGMKFGISNHFAENDWFFDESNGKDTDLLNPLYAELYGTGGGKTKSHVEKWYAIQSEITQKYKPDLIYFDFDLSNTAFNTYDQANRYQMLADYYNMALDNNMGVVCNFKNTAYTISEAVLNKEREALGYINPAVWQTDTSIGRKSWCYTTDDVYRPASEVISGLVDIVSKNGNLLINVGPMADGTMPDQIVNTLTELGAWMDKYGDAIYATRPWLVYGEGWTVNTGDTYAYKSTDIRFTKSKDGKILYATALAAPSTDTMKIRTLNSGEWDASTIASVSLIDGDNRIACEYTQTKTALEIKIPDYKNIKTAHSVEIKFKDDKIPAVALGSTDTLQPYNAYEMDGLNVEPCHADGTDMVVNTKENAYAKYILDTSKKNLAKLSVMVSPDSEGTIEVRKNDANGDLLGSVAIAKSEGDAYVSILGDVNIPANGESTHICLVFKGSIKLTEFKFMEKRGLNAVIEAEDYDEKYGTVQTEPAKDSAGGNENLGYVSPGDWVKYSAVDFGERCTKLVMRLAGSGQECFVKLDSITGTTIARTGAVNTGGWDSYKTFEYVITGVSGVHDVYIVFGSAVNVNWFKFVGKETTTTPTVKPTVPQVTTTQPQDNNGASNILTFVLVGLGTAVVVGGVAFAAMKLTGKKNKKSKDKKNE